MKNSIKNSMNPDILIELLTKRGFVLNEEKNVLEYASGSISNYTKITIHSPRNGFSIESDSYKKACFIEYESYSEPGYIECDWKRTESGSVAEDKLLDYLNSKSIRNVDEVREENLQRYLKMREKIKEQMKNIVEEYNEDYDLEY